MEAEDLNLAPQYVLRDNDTKFTAQFDAAIELTGAKINRNTPVSPNLRAHVERFIQSLKQECLNKFVIVGERRLNSRKCGGKSGVIGIRKCSLRYL